MTGSPRRTPLYDQHARHGARFVDFGGWEMPVQYSGTLKEHQAVRDAAGIFDVSHMGEIRVEGPEAIAAVNRIISNDLSRLKDGQAMYTVMCLPNGGIVDDLIVYRISKTELFLCINASNRKKDFDWVQENLSGDARATHVSDEWAQIALQGPRAQEVLSALLGNNDLAEMRPFRFADVEWNGTTLRVASTGYTGAGGYELYVPAESASSVWEGLVEAGEPLGLIPAGLGARDTLRLEMGYCLYGNDIDETTTPLEAGLGWVTKLAKTDFVGRNALVSQKERGIGRRLTGFEITGRGIARAHCPIWLGDEHVGEVTSGNMSPTLGRAIGLCYVRIAHAEPGTEVEVEIRGRRVPARIAKPPFIRKT